MAYQSAAASAPALNTSWFDILKRGALILALTFVAYLPSLNNGFIWDDDDYVTENATLRSLEGLREIWFKPGATPQYYPLVHTTFWIEYHLWGLNPRGYHLINILLHAAAAIVLWRLLLLLRVPGAWVAGAAFALHPVHVESVAWITERKNVLSGLFYFSAALMYLRWELQEKRTGTRDVLSGYILFFCALLSKTVTSTLPAALLVVLWWKRGRITLGNVLPLVPMFILGISFGLFTAWMERTRVGAVGKDWDLSFLERCIIAGRALWFYATKLLFPVNLTFIYPRWQISQQNLWLFVFPISVLLVAVFLFFMRRRWGRGPLAAMLLFAGTLFPALGFFNVFPMKYSFVADHFQYHASAALIAAGIGGAALLLRRHGNASGTSPAALIAGVLLFTYAVLTWRQTHIYKSYNSVWEDTLEKNPNSPIAMTSVASVRVSEGRTTEAMELYRRAIEASPEDDVAHFNLGKLLLEQGALDGGITHLQTSVEVSPKCAHCHYFLGVGLAQKGQQEKAIGHFEQALQLGPPDPWVHYNYAVTLVQMNKNEEAQHQFLEAIRLKQDLGYAYLGLRDLMLSHGRAAEAEQVLGKLAAHPAAPPEADVAFGDVLMSQGNPSKIPAAVTAFEAALRKRPGWDEVLSRLHAIKNMR